MQDSMISAATFPHVILSLKRPIQDRRSDKAVNESSCPIARASPK